MRAFVYDGAALRVETAAPAIEEAYQRARTVLDRVLHGNIEEMALPWESTSR